MRLYFRADCPFCWKVRVALHAFHVTYEGVETQLGEEHEDVLQVSRSQTVPVAVDGDLVLTDSAVIMEYLNEAYLDGALLPGDAGHHAALRELQSYSDKILGKPLFAVAQEKRSKPPSEWDEEKIAAATARWYENLDYLEQRTASGNILATGTPSLVDCTLLPRFGLAEIYGVAVNARHPGLQQWYSAWKHRDAFTTSRPTRKLARTE
jgi:glutathione S-transferase